MCFSVGRYRLVGHAAIRKYHMQSRAVERLMAYFTPWCSSEVHKSITDLVREANFDIEEHAVVTQDKYILIVHRIINPFWKSRRRPVLLQHGLLASSSLFLINSPEPPLTEYSDNTTNGNNIGFLLSRLGYDVWLGNFRGNRYSSGHVKLDPKKDDFWAFSFDQMQEYDLPAMIAYIRKATGSDTISYVGHSQGSQTMFALMSEKPEYSKIIKPFVAVAPVTALKNTKSPIVKYINNVFFRWMLSTKGPLIVSSAVVQRISRWLCPTKHSSSMCSNFVFSLVGYNPEQLNASRLNLYLHDMPAGTSNWNMLHLMQLMLKEGFHKFDRGHYENNFIYGQETAPIYPLEKVDSKDIAMIYSKNDLLATVEDINILKSKLRVPLMAEYVVPDEKWNHLDYFWGKDSGKHVNFKIAQILEPYRNY